MISTSRISAVKFSIIGDEEVRKNSSVGITTYDLFRDNQPYPGGIYDAHLGTTDHSYMCKTCLHTKRDCVGHFGDYELAVPIYSPAAIEDLRKWIRIVCFKCGDIVVPRALIARSPPAMRLTNASIHARAKPWDCPTCGSKHPQIRKDKEEPLLMRAEYWDVQGKFIASTEDLLPHRVLEIVSRVTDEAVLAYGKPLTSHPRNFIKTTIQIPPTNIRPDVKKINGGRSTNDYLTTMLQLIVKQNTMMPSALPQVIDEKLKATIIQIQNKYFELIKGRADADSNSVFQRLKGGKTGRFRKNLLGKRVRGMARSTIVGDSRLAVDEIGMPLAIARILQKKEVVQAFNYDRLMQYVHNGTHTYPGCTKIVRDGVEYNINTAQDMVLQFGDVLHRDYITGDEADFNRQPSLELSSIASVRVRVYQDPNIKVFGMNVLMCVYFNADFDGDQMNVISYSSIPAQVEARELASIKNWTVSHTTAAPRSGQTDDSVIGLFELTRTGVKFDKQHAAMLFQNCTWTPELTESEYTGRDIISLILQRTPVSLTRTAEWYRSEFAPYIEYDKSETHVVIQRGKHISGVLDKKTIGKGVVGGLYHIIANDYGNAAALEVMFNMQQIAIAYILQFGYTIGILDLHLSKSAAEQVRQVTNDILTKSALITDQLVRGEIIPPIDKTVGEFYEEMQINTLSQLDEFVGPIISSINPRTNNLFKMIACGDKGKFDNMCNMKSAIGQQLINGERMRLTFGPHRTSPYFARFDTSARARGYIANSYSVGMTSTEYMANAGASRFALISKALSTSVTGEQDRNSVNNFNSIIVNSYRFVVKELGALVSLAYGSDLLDPRKLERVTMPHVMMNREAMAKWAGVGESKTQDPYFEQLWADAVKYRSVFCNIEATNTKEILSPERYVAFNASRVLDEVVLASPPYVANKAECAMMGAKVLAWSLEGLPQLIGAGPIPSWIRDAVWMSAAHARATLRPSAMSGLSPVALDRVLETLSHKFLMAIIDPGAAVGIIAAKSFSEPFTQYMLDAHHRSAAGGTSKSGMTRSKEVLGAKPLARTANPTMMMETTCTTQEEVQQLCNAIEMMALGQFVSRYGVYYEKFGQPVHSATRADVDWIASFIKGNVLIPIPGDLTRWCLRFVINPMTLMLKGMSIELIVLKLRMAFPDTYIMYTPENAKTVIVRVYTRSNMFKSGAAAGDMIKLAEDMMSTTIRGVDGVITATPMRLIRHRDIENPTRTDVWGITTRGCNISGVLVYTKIIGETLVTNVITEMQRVFGIEAARQRIIYELRNIVDKCNYRHYQIYANEMTYTGVVTNVERTGLRAREPGNILLRMGFSSPIPTIEEAALNGLTDKVTGISAPLLVGAVPRHGSLYSQLYVNTGFVSANVKSANTELDDLLD